MEASLVVKAIILNRDLRKLLLIQRSATDASGAGTWEGVGGSIERGESPAEAILRESREEVYAGLYALQENGTYRYYEFLFTGSCEVD